MYKDEHMWDLESARSFVALIHPKAFESGYNLHIGGGVLLRGYSDNDLDVVAIPRPNKPNPHPRALFSQMWDLGMKRVKDFQVGNRFVYKWVSQKKKNVDLIVVDLTHPEAPGNHNLTGSKELTPEEMAAWEAEYLEKLEGLRLEEILRIRESRNE